MTVLSFVTVYVNRAGGLLAVFLTDWILVFVLLVSFINCFYQVCGWTLTWLLRMVLWRMFNASIRFQLVKINLLSARFLFRSMVIITENQVLTVGRGCITWRYWLRYTRRNAFDVARAADGGGACDDAALKNQSRPARLLAELEGVEWFMFNNTPQYETAMQSLRRDEGGSNYKPTLLTLSSSSAVLVSDEDNMGIFMIGRVLPVDIAIKRGAVTIGNETTPTLSVNSYNTARGLVDVAPAAVLLDLYRMAINMEMKQFVSKILPNPGFVQQHAEDVAEDPGVRIRRRQLFYNRYQSEQRQSLGGTRSHWRDWLDRALGTAHLSRFQRSRRVDTTEDVKWRGLTKYLLTGDYDEDLDGELNDLLPFLGRNHEYATVLLIVDAEACLMTYYWDSPGLVPHRNEGEKGGAQTPNGENDPPPYTGVELLLSQTTMHYGPWTDKQRIPLQQMLFPTVYRDGEPYTPLVAGQRRVYTGFKLQVEVQDELVLRVPFRETSKDKSILGGLVNRSLGEDVPIVPLPGMADETVAEEAQQDTAKVAGVRPFGWVELVCDQFSTITVDTEYCATAEGWNNKFQLTLLEPVLRTSVNHDKLFEADKHLVVGQCGYPLAWNGACEWVFTNELHNAQVYALREHITLLVDMFQDFLLGEPTPYELFRPFVYRLEWQLVNGYRLFMNVNDGNIINNPLDFDDNCYLVFAGDTIEVEARIPLEEVYSKSTVVDFSVHTPQFELELRTPPWHTTNGFMHNQTLGRAHNFGVQGQYTYYANVEVGLVDTIVVACLGDDITLQCYGFLVRYFVVLIDNYFGTATHFRTLQEYTDSRQRQPTPLAGVPPQSSDPSATEPVTSASQAGEPVPPVDRLRKDPLRVENELDVLFLFLVRRGNIVLPSHVYSVDRSVLLLFQQLDIDIRFTNYYMDLQANFLPVYGQHHTGLTAASVWLLIGGLGHGPMPSELTIDGAAIHAHRMFGRPPSEPTYHCKWDFVFDAIAIDLGAGFLAGVLKSVSTLVFGYVDAENALAVNELPVYDVTCVLFACPQVDVAVRAPESGYVVRLQLYPVRVTLNDAANNRYSQQIDASIPHIVVSVDNADGACVAGLETALHVTDFCHKYDFFNRRQWQQDHVRNHDSPFHRAEFLLRPENRDEWYNHARGSIVPLLLLPDLALPITEETIDRVLELLGISRLALYGAVRGGVSGAPLLMSVAAALVLSTESTAVPMIGSDSRPLTQYRDADYRPRVKPDPNYEVDSFVVNVGAVQGFVDPSCAEHLVQLVAEMQCLDAESVMDTIEMDVIKRLLGFTNPELTWINVRMVAPTVLVLVGQFRFPLVRAGLGSTAPVPTSAGRLSDSPRLPPHLSVRVDGPSFALRTKDTKKPIEGVQPARYTTVPEFTVAWHVLRVCAEVVGELEVDISTDDSMWHPSAVVVVVEDILGWVDEPTPQQRTALVLCSSVDVLVQLDQLSQVTDFADYLVEAGRRTAAAQAAVPQCTMREAALMYSLLKASKDHDIEDDLAVLTKPAYIIRVSDDHVRANDSWRVVTRLRHILRQLPPGTTCTVDPHRLPSLAYEEVVRVFATWRLWEFGDIANSYIFRHVFPESQRQVPPSATHVQAGMDSMVVRMEGAPEEEEDYILVNHVEAVWEDGQGADPTRGFVKVGGYRLRVSPLVLVLKQIVSRFLGELELVPAAAPVAETPLFASASHTSANFTVLVSLFEQRVELGTTAAVLSLESCLLLAELWPPRAGCALAAVGYASVSVFSREQPLFLGTVREHTLVVASIGGWSSGQHMLRLTNRRVDIRSEHDVARWIETAHDVMKEWSWVSRELGSGETLAGEAVPFSIPLFGTITMDLNVEEVVSRLELLSPVRATAQMRHGHVRVQASRDRVVARATLGSCTSEVGAHDSTVAVRSELRNGELAVKARVAEREVAVLADCERLHCDMTVRSVVGIVRQVNLKMALLQTLLQELRKKMQSLAPVTSLAPATTLSPTLAAIPVKFVCFVSLLDVQLLVVPPDRLSIALRLWKVHGHVRLAGAVPSGKLTVPLIQIVHSQRHDETVVVDAHVAVRCDLTGNGECADAPSTSLEVESRFCRVLFTPGAVVLVALLADEVSGVVDELQPTSAAASAQPANLATQSKFPFASIQLLAYATCFGFVFDTHAAANEPFPGLIVGCERAFVAMDRRLGKLTLVDLYVLMAHGSTHDTFYSQGCEKDTLTRAFLPRMQMVYVRGVDLTQLVVVRTTGEQVDVRVELLVVAFVDKLVQAWGAIRTRLDEVCQPRTPAVVEVQPPADTDYMGALGSVFKLLECTMSFAGGSLVLYPSVQTLVFGPAPRAAQPLLLLHSPAVKISTGYRRLANNHHAVNMDVWVLLLDNTVYARCVPVVVDMWRQVSAQIGAAAQLTGSSPSPPASPHVSPLPAFPSVLFLQALLRADFHFGLRIDEQSLVLSCEPTAKVAAQVRLGGIAVQIQLRRGAAVLGSVRVVSLESLLLHVYLQQRSAHVHVDECLLTARVMLEPIQIHSTGRVRTVTGAVNMRQLQDLDLFADIWWPRLLRGRQAPVAPPPAAPSAPAFERLREVDARHGVPWTVYNAIDSITVAVDLGQLLGTTTAVVERVWMALRRRENQLHHVNLGCGHAGLVCEGRLSGSCGIRHIEANLALQLEQAHRHPLWLLLLRVASIQANAAFDFRSFLVANMEHLLLHAFNQQSTLHDRLVVMGGCEAVEGFVTTIVAAHVRDIIQTLERLLRDTQTLYRETLSDSNQGHTLLAQLASASTLRPVAPHATEFSLQLGRMAVHVYPSNLLDTQALTVNISEASARFTLNLADPSAHTLPEPQVLSNRLVLYLSNVRVSLATTPDQPQVDDFARSGWLVDQYVANARRAAGGTLFVFPLVSVDTTTFQALPDGRTIDYLYELRFGGRVEIRWNLGSVQFIREMWNTHVRALALRLPQESEMGLEERLVLVEADSKYTYHALAPVVADTPQLRELGDATPPLEWFGLHRKQFPKVVHRAVVFPLQTVVDQATVRYLAMLDKYGEVSVSTS